MPVDRRELAAIFAGGFVGTVARAVLDDALVVSATSWPWSTFIVNIAGAFALGYFTARLRERPPPPSAHLPALLGPGLCGALTTFSTMQLELLRMLDDGRLPLAAAYALISVAGGVAAVAVASGLARRAREST